MVIFHFTWDLNFFGHISVAIPDGPFWREFRALIVTLFLFTMGVSLVYAYRSGIDNKKLLRRMVKLVAAALLITATTMITTPKFWVYFGILHFIALATIVCVWFVNKPNIALLLGLAIMSLYVLTEFPVKWPFIYFADHLPEYTVDIVTLVPWLAVPFIGIWAGHRPLLQTPAQQPAPKVVSVLSTNALIIYLIHQPIFFALFHSYDWLLQ